MLIPYAGGGAAPGIWSKEALLRVTPVTVGPRRPGTMVPLVVCLVPCYNRVYRSRAISMEVGFVRVKRSAIYQLPEIHCPRCKRGHSELGTIVRVVLRPGTPSRPLVRCLKCQYEWRTTSLAAYLIDTTSR